MTTPKKPTENRQLPGHKDAGDRAAGPLEHREEQAVGHQVAGAHKGLPDPHHRGGVAEDPLDRQHCQRPDHRCPDHHHRLQRLLVGRRERERRPGQRGVQVPRLLGTHPAGILRRSERNRRRDVTCSRFR